MLLRLKRQFSPYFWTNVSDPRFGIAGIIEYTNLNRERCPNGDSLVYIPQYLPSDSPRYMMEDQKLLDEYVGYLALLQKGFDKSEVRESWVFRDRYAQPICRVGFTAEMAGIASPIDGLYLTDSHQLFPDDRTIGNSIGLGKKAARLIARQQAVERERTGAPA